MPEVSTSAFIFTLLLPKDFLALLIAVLSVFSVVEKSNGWKFFLASAKALPASAKFFLTPENEKSPRFISLKAEPKPLATETTPLIALPAAIAPLTIFLKISTIIDNPSSAPVPATAPSAVTNCLIAGNAGAKACPI